MEAHLHRQVCEYLRLQYPEVLFNSDGAGNNVSRTQARMNTALRSSRGFPDLFIAESRNGKHGLFLELKREGTIIYLRNGQITKNQHIREQDQLLNELYQRGYVAEFGVGFEATKKLIDDYLR